MCSDKEAANSRDQTGNMNMSTYAAKGAVEWGGSYGKLDSVCGWRCFNIKL